MWEKHLHWRFFFLIFFFFSHEAVRFGTLVLFACADRSCFLLCSGSFCLCSEHLIYLFTWRRVYKISQYAVIFFPFHKKDPRYPSNWNLSLISRILFLQPFSWERRWLERAVFWWWSVLKYCFRNIHRILTSTTLPQFVVWRTPEANDNLQGGLCTSFKECTYIQRERKQEREDKNNKGMQKTYPKHCLAINETIKALVYTEWLLDVCYCFVWLVFLRVGGVGCFS